ncbi:enolase C-terminal domain-like protein [Fuerstiella marisgermanici]|uniref:L-Ala-D/L-Glu epimerase n=1 Tax=Fuerstiella marisgermanici TaxID=1891926 RepID=A0A1P8W936_9PLAN|nr:enolase C-terminal domain-like protein [Fuerstiella marisgermanici]APZ90567.1 L-Ala-D/L-Glu epimerase [Fuerstiella marisgermanici]
MRIRELTAFEVPVVLKKPVRHASHVRDHNDTLIIRCELTDGSVGWGEGLPRTYVTGESIDSVWRHLNAADFSKLAEADFSGPLDAVTVLDAFQLPDVATDDGVIARECFGNTVRCALELAILDAVFRSINRPLGDLVSMLPDAANVVAQRDEVFYSGVITSATPLRQWRSALKMRLFRFPQLKVKVGTSGIDDAALLNRVRKIVGRKVDLRLDANEAWHCDDVVAKMKPLLPFRPSCLEQPVRHADVAGLADLRHALGVPIMLDESLCCREDAQRAIDGKTCDFFNLRLSKCGGFVSCVRLAILAKQNGLGYQLGCQVGETGILSAAGRHFACNVAGIRYLEGSFDRFLVRDSLTVEDLTFRFGGRGKRLPGPGLGITVSEQRLRQLAVRNIQLLTEPTKKT